MHHEPIWRGMIKRRGSHVVTHPLANLYADILDAINWTSPQLHDSILAFDRFPDTLENGLQRQAQEIEALLAL
jgi:hypothetical protein